MNHKTAIFAIEGGVALDLVKQHIAERQRVNRANKALLEELGNGVTKARTNAWSGVLLSVVFPNKVPNDWTRPDKHGCSRPKAGTEWARRFASQVGYARSGQDIARTFQIPTSLQYKTDGGWGSRFIGNVFALDSCGFLYLSAEGPYAMWIPDVAAEVADEIARGNTVEEPAASFKAEFEGCRRIDQEEWELMVAQHNLEKKRRLIVSIDGKAVEHD